MEIENTKQYKLKHAGMFQLVPPWLHLKVKITQIFMHGT